MYANASDMLWKALLTEFLGTLVIVLVVILAVISIPTTGLSPVGAALAYGLAFAAMYYIFMKYGAGHFNPAVSFGFAVAGRMSWGLMLGFWIAQILGGIAAAGLALYFFGSDSGVGASIGTLTKSNVLAAFILEGFLTMILVLVFLFVTASPMLAIVSGLVIGLVISALMLTGYQGTGGSNNPARALGPAIFSNNLGTIWIYIVGPLVGALIAALVYKLLTVDFSCCDKVDENGCKILDECGIPLKECRRPVVDNCGNAVTNCDGIIYEKYTKHDRKLGHYQETYMSALGGWMNSHGVDPLYVQQEFGRAVEKVIPNGVMEEPHTVVNAIITPIAGLGVPANTIAVTGPAAGFGNSQGLMAYRVPTLVQPL